MTYEEMLGVWTDAPIAPLVAVAITLPQSDPAHDLAWLTVVDRMNDHARAILDYLHARNSNE